ncbi:MAG: thermonuclease family protein [Ignavibacteria bacterium]
MTFSKFKLFILIILISISNISISSVADTSLVIGTFKMSKVIDGDTFRFDGMDKSTRLLGIDTEETFKSDDAFQKTAEIAQFWEEFYKIERGDNKMPVKTDSPMGFEAWKWADEFFKDVEYVRLEKDDNDRTIDIFGRYLVYLIAIKNGTEINYNVECVRQGYSPYFNKYGISKRFHDDFVTAQNYARENRLGIWDPDKKHYPDYNERIIWWDKRADQLKNFDEKYFSNDNFLNLGNDRDFKRLTDYVGKEITVFGSIGDILTKKLPYILRIPHDKNEAFEIVVFEENLNILNELDLETKREYYIYMRGKLEFYKGNYQMVLKDRDQLWME